MLIKAENELVELELDLKKAESERTKNTGIITTA